MLIRAVTLDDTQTWLNLSHEWDDIVSQLIPDISMFYEGFDDYMVTKINQNEAFIAIHRLSGRCLGIVAFSKDNNRISYLGVSKNVDFQLIGSKLMEVAINQLDMTREISANVFKSDLAPVKQERTLYESYGFTERGTVLEVGIPACMMKKPPEMEKRGYSFHYDYPGYIDWTKQQKCPLCNNEPVWSDHVLVAELKHSYVKASIQAQGCLWGKCVVQCKKHYVELHDIPTRDLADFIADVKQTSKALKEVSGAVKINMELHGNTIPHLHIHLFPRYIDDLHAGKAIDITKTEPSPYENKAEFEYFIEQMRLKLTK